MEEVEEVVENLMHNEIDLLDLSFEFAQQAPFTTLLYRSRVPDFSDDEFATLLQVLMDALEENTSVKQLHIDWAFLRLLQAAEQEFLMRRLGHLSQLCDVSISGATANTNHQHLSVFSFLRLLEGQRSTFPSLQKLTMDAMGSLKIQDWLYVPRLSRALESTASCLQILRLENLVVPQQPNFPALDPLIETLATSCPVLEQLYVAVSLPRQYRRIHRSLCTASTLKRLTTPKTIRLNNWGLQHDHVINLLNLPGIESLDVWNNPLAGKSGPGSSAPYVNLLVNRQQMSLRELRGIHDEKEELNALLEVYLLLNRCGRARAGDSLANMVEYLDAMNQASYESQGVNSRTTVNTQLNALYTAIREQPFV